MTTVKTKTVLACPNFKNVKRELIHTAYCTKHAIKLKFKKIMTNSKV